MADFFNQKRYHVLFWLISMRLFFQSLIVLFCGGFLSLASANVEQHFNHIKQDPNALYAFLKKMPKGGELHFHLAGSNYAETMLQFAADKHYCLNPKTHALNMISAICTNGSVKDILNKPKLYNTIIDSWSMRHFKPGTETGHDHFYETFDKFAPMVYQQSAFFLADAMQHAAAQHELYMEVMLMPDLAESANFAAHLPKTHDWVKLKEDLLANPKFKASIKKTAGVTYISQAKSNILACDTTPLNPACQVTVKLQYHILREQPLASFFAQALHGFAAVNLSDDFVGINIVQPEDGIIALRDYHAQMEILAFLHQAYPDVHISLHAGELVPAEVTPNDIQFHINEAIKIGHAERIGHGVDIAFERDAQGLLKYMSQHAIPVEINLTSNEMILGISPQQHPLKLYLKHQVPVVLSTDDEGILRTDLTQQYVKAVQEHGVDYQTLQRINRNTLEFSFMAGKSLWQNYAKLIPVVACQNFKSVACKRFIENNLRAKLQLQLEVKLNEFAQQFH